MAAGVEVCLPRTRLHASLPCPQLPPRGGAGREGRAGWRAAPLSACTPWAGSGRHARPPPAALHHRPAPLPPAAKTMAAMAGQWVAHVDLYYSPKYADRAAILADAIKKNGGLIVHTK